MMKFYGNEMRNKQTDALTTGLTRIILVSSNSLCIFNNLSASAGSWTVINREGYNHMYVVEVGE